MLRAYGTMHGTLSLKKTLTLPHFFANFFTGFKFHVASFFGLGCDIEACMEAWKRV
jgi:hypothetical protein